MLLPCQLRKILKHLETKHRASGTEFVYGKGKRKTAIQRAIEKVTEYEKRQKGYERDIRILKGRNSYAKTDHEATFMRMKEEHMRNGVQRGNRGRFGVCG